MKGHSYISNFCPSNHWLIDRLTETVNRMLLASSRKVIGHEMVDWYRVTIDWCRMSGILSATGPTSVNQWCVMVNRLLLRRTTHSVIKCKQNVQQVYIKYEGMFRVTITLWTWTTPIFNYHTLLIQLRTIWKIFTLD